MRILFCNYEYPPLGGGGGVINALLAEELAKRHEVTVLTSQGPGFPCQSDDNGVHVLRVPVFFRRQQAAASLASMFAYMVMGTRAGKKHLATNTYDIINTHFVLPSGPVGDALSRFANIPNVLSVHGGDLYDPSKWTSPHRHTLLRAWVKSLLKRASQVVGQSRNTLDNVHHFYAPELNGLQIPLGIRRPPMDVAIRHQYGFQEDDILLITVGRLVTRKAVEQLISMLARIKLPNTHLLVLGTGLLEQRLREQSGLLGVSDRIHFLGYVEEIEKFRLLRMSNLFVSTSQHEGFGLVFLEAMACGLPVVCYDHGGQTDFLENGTTGYLVPLNNTTEFEHCCRTLMMDQEIRKRISKENLKRVEPYYIDCCARQYETVFEQAIQVHRKERALGYPYRS